MKLNDAADAFATYARAHLARTTASAYANHVRRFARWMGPDAVLSDFTTARCRAYMDEIGDTLAGGSRCVYILGLRKFAGFLKTEYKLRGPNPAQALKLPKSTSLPRLLITDEEIQALFEATYRFPKQRQYRPVLARAILSLLAFTGVRCMELLAINVEHLRLDEGLLYIPAGKGNKEAYVAINADCKQALCELLQVRAQIEAQEQKNGRPGYLHSGLLAATVNNRVGLYYLHSMLDELTALARLNPKKPIRPHAFRHAYASRLERNGASLNQVREALRHEKLETTQRYLHVMGVDMQHVAELASLRLSPPKPEQVVPLQVAAAAATTHKKNMERRRFVIRRSA